MSKSKLFPALLLITLISGCSDENYNKDNCGMSDSSINSNSLDTELCKENFVGNALRMIYPDNVAIGGVVSKDEIFEERLKPSDKDPELNQKSEENSEKIAIARDPFNSYIKKAGIIFFAYCAIIVFLSKTFFRENVNGKPRYTVMSTAIGGVVFFTLTFAYWDTLDNGNAHGIIVIQTAFTGEKIGSAAGRMMIDGVIRGDSTLEETQHSQSYFQAIQLAKSTVRAAGIADQTDKALIYTFNVDKSLKKQEPVKQMTFSTDDLFFQHSDVVSIHRGSKTNTGTKYYQIGTIPTTPESFGPYQKYAEKANYKMFLTDDMGQFDSMLKLFADNLKEISSRDKDGNNENIKATLTYLAMMNRDRVLTKLVKDNVKRSIDPFYLILEQACADIQEGIKIPNDYIKYLNGGDFKGHNACIKQNGTELIALGKGDAERGMVEETITTRKAVVDKVYEFEKQLVEEYNKTLVAMNVALSDNLKSVASKEQIERMSKGGSFFMLAGMLDFYLTNNSDGQFMSLFANSYNIEITTANKMLVADGFLSKANNSYAVVPYINLEMYLGEVEKRLNIAGLGKNAKYETLTPAYFKEHYASSATADDLMTQLEYQVSSLNKMFFDSVGITKQCMADYSACEMPKVSPIKTIITLGQYLMNSGSSGYLATITAIMASNGIAKIAQGGKKDAAIGKAKNKKRQNIGKGAKLASVVAVVFGGIFLMMILAGAILVYLLPILITVPIVHTFLNYLVFVLILPIIADLQLLRLTLPNDRDNWFAIGDKYIKIMICVLTFSTVNLFAAITTITLISVMMYSSAWAIYLFVPQGDFISDVIGYVLIATCQLAIVIMCVKSVYTTIIKNYLGWLDMEYIMIGEPMQTVDATQTIFYKLIPAYKAMQAIAPALKNKQKRKQSDLEDLN